MRSVTPMKTAKTGYIIISILLCALGITLLVEGILSLCTVVTMV